MNNKYKEVDRMLSIKKEIAKSTKTSIPISQQKGENEMNECIIDRALTCEHNEINGKLCSACEIPNYKPISLERGKYTFYMKGGLKCDRYGESWRELIGDNAIFFLYLKCLELSRRYEGQAVEIDKLRSELEMYKFNTGG